MIKVHAVYSTPFWREDGLSGTGFGAGSLVQEVTTTPTRGLPRNPSGLHFGRKGGRRLRTECRRTASAPSWNPSPASSGRRRWSRRSTTNPTGARRSGPAAPMRPATTWAADRYGKDQHAPVGPIYWCSSDLAAEGYQHVDGAVRMGHRRRYASRGGSRQHGVPQYRSDRRGGARRRRGRRRLTSPGPHPFNDE